MVQKSCTIWYGKYPIICMALYIPGAAGFLPSKVLRDLDKAKKAASPFWVGRFLQPQNPEKNSNI